MRTASLNQKKRNVFSARKLSLSNLLSHNRITVRKIVENIEPVKKKIKKSVIPV